MSRLVLLKKIRACLVKLLGGYIQAGELSEDRDSYVAPIKLEDLADVLGALAVAEEAFYHSQSPFDREETAGTDT